MDPVKSEPETVGEVGSHAPITEVVGLSDVNLEVLLEDMETVCSSQALNGVSGDFTGDSASKNYLWCTKKSSSSLQYNESTKTSSLKINRSSYESNSDSDIGSTCGMVNIHNDSRFNMCENPSDLWFGLKMSDGTPVVINSRSRNYRRPHTGRKTYRNNNVNRFSRSSNGPIDYSTGFLSIAKYIGIGSKRSDVYLSSQSVHHSVNETTNLVSTPRSKGRGFYKSGMNGKHGMGARQDRVRKYLAKSSTTFNKM